MEAGDKLARARRRRGQDRTQLAGHGDTQVTRIFRHDPIDFRSMPPAITALMIANVVGFLVGLMAPGDAQPVRPGARSR